MTDTSSPTEAAIPALPEGTVILCESPLSKSQAALKGIADGVFALHVAAFKARWPERRLQTVTVESPHPRSDGRWVASVALQVLPDTEEQARRLARRMQWVPGVVISPSGPASPPADLAEMYPAGVARSGVLSLPSWREFRATYSDPDTGISMRVLVEDIYQGRTVLRCDLVML